MFFPMLCDLYYASEKQDKYGKIEKKWVFTDTIQCSFFTLNDELRNSDKFGTSQEQFFELESRILGRSITDIRSTKDGQFFPMTHILVTNIRSSSCSDELFFRETNGGYEAVPTIFEPSSIQPYIGAFNRIEYYKIVLSRSDIQELSSDAC